jgi:hypothetical protein
LNILDKLSSALKKIKINDRGSRIRFRKGAWILVPAFSIAMFMPVATPVQATFETNTQINLSNGEGFLQGEFAEVGVRANGAFGSTSVPSGFHANPTNCLGFRVDREMDGWGTTTDDGDYFCPGSPFEGWQMKVAGSIGKNDNGQTGIAGGVSGIQDSGSSQCVSWISASPYNGVSVSQRYCVPTAGQALHTDVTLTNTTGSAIENVYFGRGFDPDNATGSGAMTCAGGTVSTSMFQSCNAVTGQGTEAQATARWGNTAFIALQSFDARARVARQTGGFSSPDPADIWNAGNTLASSGTYLGNVGEMYADAGIYVALNVPTLGAGSSTSFRISYVLSADGNNAPVLGSPVVSGIGQTSATVASTVNPKGFSTTANLLYSIDPDFATSSSVSMGTFTGADEVAINAEIISLDPSETYYAKIVATNETGTTESAVFEFDTLAATAPIVSSEEPTVTVDDGPVTLSGTLNPNGFSSTATFQYSTTADFSGTIVDIPVSGTFTGTSLSSVSTVVSGLTGATTYYFRLKVTNASGSAYGSTLSFVPADLVAPVGILVTSLADDGSNGTLRWAINQANATAGGIYDAILFGLDGTITLTSALPQITQSVTITGNGITNTIIDGNSLYRPFNVASGKTLTVSDMMLKRGQNTNGGLIYNGSGTVNATDVRFTSMTGGSAVFNNNNNSLATYTDCQFDYLNYGIAGDYGSTPYLATGVDSWSGTADTVFTNRTYVLRGQFSNNSYGIMNYRFTKVENSTFSNNTWAASITGINRTQITGSTFSSNGIAIYHNSWVPVGWNVGKDFRFINNNTFTNNGTSIYLDDGYNNNRKNPGWSTITNNSFDESGTWVTYYLWNGTSNVEGTVGFNEATTLFTQSANVSVATTTTTTTSTTSTTSTVPYSPPPVEVPTGTSIPETVTPVIPLPETPLPEETFIGPVLPPVDETPDSIPDYTAPEEPVIIPDMPDAGRPIATEDLTDILDTVFVPDASPEEMTTVLDGLLDTELTGKQFDAVIDATLGSFDEPGADVGAVIDSFLGADLSDREFTKVLDAVFSEDVSTEVFTEALTTMLDADLSDAEFDKVLDAAFSETTSPEVMVSALGSLFDGPASGEDISKFMGAVFDEDISVEDTKTVLGDLLGTTLSMSEAEAVFDNVFDADLSDAETIDLIVDVLKDGLTADNLGAALGAVFDEEVSSEVLIETFTAVLGNELNPESVGVIVDVLESDTITNDQVSQVVDLITGQEGGIAAGQSAELSASPKVLESITPDQATEVFAALDVTNVTPEQEAELAQALTNAPNDIKEALEEEVDIYGDGFDDYVAVGSQVDVGARRTLIAATTAVAAITAAGAATGGPGSSGGNSGGGNSNGPSGTNNNVAKRNEEEEMAGEIAGPGDDEDSNFTKNSIFKYYIKEGIEMREFNWLGFGKKLWDITAGLAFTFAGSVVVYYTLSGTTQTIALASTVTACVVHYAHQLLKNDEE